MWAIVRDALAGASPSIRGQLRLIAVLWVLVVVAQIWDSRDGRGAAGIAEFLSAILGLTGLGLLGLTHTITLTMQEASSRRSAEDAGAVQHVLLALPALGFAAGAALAAAALLMVIRPLLGAELPLAIVGVVFYSAALVFAGRTVTRSARTLFDHATMQAAAAAQARSEATTAQLSALQARMNPHFLFNALNTVASLVRSNPPAAERVVENLSDVMRRTLERSAETSGTVQEELDYVRSYLALEQERWGDRLRVVWDVDPDVTGRPLPPLVLQPLVENSLRHGLSGRIEGGELRITVGEGAAGALIVRVEDDGIGFAPRWREGTGLGNLRQRLRTLYGDAATLQTEARDSGACVTVTVPAATAAQRRI